MALVTRARVGPTRCLSPREALATAGPSPVLEAHGALPGVGPPQGHSALGAHAVAAALAHGAPVEQEPQRPLAAGTGLLSVLPAHTLRASPPQMLQTRLQLPMAQRVTW